MAGWASILDFLEAAAPYVEAGGAIAQGVSGNRAAGRAAENTNLVNQDQAALQRYNIEQRAKAEAAFLAEQAVKDRADRYLTAGRDRAKQVGLGDLLANMQDVGISGLPSYIPNVQFSGGMRPSAFGANARQAGRNLSRDALQAQITGADVPNLPDLSGLGANAPELSELMQSGTLDDVLNWLSVGGLASKTARNAAQQVEQDRINRTPIPNVGPVASDATIGETFGQAPTDAIAGMGGITPLPAETLASRRLTPRGYQIPPMASRMR